MRKYLNQSGQSLIESIVAISIIVIGLIAILSLASVSLKSGIESKDQIIATNLAREGIEAVRNIRDNNWLEGDVWDKDLNKDKYIAFFDKNANKWSLKTSNDLKLYVKDNLYTHDTTGTSTKFSRLITIDDIIAQSGNPAGKKITSEVTWVEQGNSRDVTLIDYLYDWKKI